MEDIRQSLEYAEFMKLLGWRVERAVNDKNNPVNIFIRKFPLIGSFIKVLRIGNPIPFSEIEKIAKKYNAFKMQIEPNVVIGQFRTPRQLAGLRNDQNRGYCLAKSSYVPSKTLLIDLKPSAREIFGSFSPEKRRAIRRAKKNNLIITSSEDIDGFIGLKNKQLWPFGFLLSGEINKLWMTFNPAGKAKLLMACDDEKKAIAGVLLLFHKKTAYYWLASATSAGKKLFAPGLLVWEAVKLSKKIGCAVFDFEGIEDPRFPQTKSWRGFTKFKSGFGGKEITYCLPYQKLFRPTL